MRTELRVLGDVTALTLDGVLIVVAIAGKIASGLGVVGKGIDRLTVGIGGKPIIDNGVFSAMVIVVIVTTVVTPPALKWSINRNR